MSRPCFGSRRCAARGFTLIELLITLAIVAILSSIAYPSFAHQVQQARRTEAIGALQEVLLAQEHWRAAQGTYATRFKLAGPALQRMSDDAADAAQWTLASGLYRLDVAAGDGERYIVRAAAVSAQSVDAACATMTVQVSPGAMAYEPKRCFLR
jgi:type IV pilus assembly protein PilE